MSRSDSTNESPLIDEELLSQELASIAASAPRAFALRDILPLLLRAFAPTTAAVFIKTPHGSAYSVAAAFPDALRNEEGLHGALLPRRLLHRLQGPEAHEGILLIDQPSNSDARALLTFKQRLALELVIGVRSSQPAQPLAAVIALGWKDRIMIDDARLIHAGRTVADIASLIASNTTAQHDRDRDISFVQTLSGHAVDSDGVYNSFLEALYSLGPTKFISLWLYQPSNDAFLARAFYSRLPRLQGATFSSFDTMVVSAATTVSGQTLATGQPIIISKLSRDAHFANPYFSTRYGLDWFLSFPVASQHSGHPIGVINVWPQGYAEEFPDERIRTYREYAQYLEIAVRTATLLFKEHLLTTRDTFFRELLRLGDDPTPWDGLASTVRDQLNCESCSIFVLDDVGPGVLRLQGTTGLLNTQTTDRSSVTYLPGEGLTGFAFRQAEPVLYYRELRDRFRTVHVSKFREHEPPASSIILGQLRDALGRPIGVVRCSNKRERPRISPARFTLEDSIAMSTDYSGRFCIASSCSTPVAKRT